MYLSKFKLAICAFLGAVIPLKAFASTPSYTPLITSTTFDGVRTDVTTTAVGVISVVVIIVGVSMIVRAFTR